MKLNHQILMFLLLSICSSCISDLDFDEDIGETKLVVISRFNPDSMVVALSSSIPSDNNAFQVPNLQMADVIVSDNDGAKWNLEFLRRQNDQFYFSDLAFLPENGRNYYLNIIQPNYASVESNSYLPFPPTIQDYAIEILETDSIEVGDQKIGRTRFSFNFQLESKTAEDEFFGLKIIAIISDTLDTQPPSVFEYPVQINTNNIESEDLSYNLISKTNQFQWDKSDNTEGAFEMYAEIWYPSLSTSVNKKIKGFEVILESQTEDLFLFYQQARIQYLLADPNVPIINEPVILYSNIENGIGVFSGYNTIKDTLLLP